MPKQDFNVAQYLLYRLHQFGAKDIFAVCGDFLLGFLEQVLKSPVNLINCCNELNAGYAADGYARINGLGAIATTFTVGELSAINAVAGSWAENLPVVMIAGAPERQHQLAGKMLHHTLGDYAVARDMFRKVTVACEFLNDPLTAPQQIDEALKLCLYHKKPIYFEIPADMVTQKCAAPGPISLLEKSSVADNLQEAAAEALTMLKQAKNPVILLGFEVMRHGLQDAVLKLIEKTGYPYCTFTTAKNTLSEEHPQFIGCYKGAWSRDYVKEVVETADCILMLGGFFIDSDTGGYTAKLDKNKLIMANFEQVAIKNHVYPQVMLGEFINTLTSKVAAGKFPQNLTPAITVMKNREKYVAQDSAKLTTKRFFNRMASFLRPDDIVVVDVGDCLYSMAGTLMPKGTTFISEAFYNSIGYSVGAALGAAVAAPNRRLLLLVGDGSFQLTAQEISTMLRYKLKPIVFLFNNQGYGIERAIHDNKHPNSFNDLQPWRYHLIPQTFGGEAGVAVATEGGLENALVAAEKSDKLSFIEVQVDKYDFGDTLRMAGSAMAENSKGSYE